MTSEYNLRYNFETFNITENFCLMKFKNKHSEITFYISFIESI